MHLENNATPKLGVILKENKEQLLDIIASVCYFKNLQYERFFFTQNAFLLNAILFAWFKN